MYPTGVATLPTHRDDRRRPVQPADHDVYRRPRAGGAVTRRCVAPGGPAGFTLVEAMVATLALLCFVVAVLGPLLLRVSRLSSSVTASQYRTAAMVAASRGR